MFVQYLGQRPFGTGGVSSLVVGTVRCVDLTMGRGNGETGQGHCDAEDEAGR